VSAVIWALSTPHLAHAVLASAALFLAWLAVRRVVGT